MSEAGIRVRPMTLADVPAVLRVEATWRGPRRADAVRRLLSQPQAWCQVAQRGRSVVGYVFAQQAADEVELHDVAVDPRARRAGVGRALLGALMRWSAQVGAAQVFLEVRASNGPAQALYRAFGFDAVGRRRRYYSDGEDALVFSASPSPSSTGAAGGTADEA